MDLSQRMDIDKWEPEAVARRVAEEVVRQDARYGPFTNDVGSVRLAIACMEDEIREARESWEEWKKRPDWYGVRGEVVQVAAIAQRLARDLIVEIVD
jgi:hypothetical protein